jgi:hypothetical protein
MISIVVAVVLSFVCASNAYAIRSNNCMRVTTKLHGVKSKSVPFLDAPKNLGKGLVGDKGFDPLGFTDYISPVYLREAELKHGRVAMLGALGFGITDFIKLPGDVHNVSPVEAHDAFVDNGALGQVFFFVAAIEAVSIVAIKQTMDGSGRTAGDLGLGELTGFGKLDEKKQRDLQLKELENGRLAMIAFGGMVTQAVLFAKPFPY